MDFDDTLNDSGAIFASKLDGLFHTDGRRIYRIFMNEIHDSIVHKKNPEKHDDWDFQVKLLLKIIGEPYNNNKVKEFKQLFHEAAHEVLINPNLFPDAPRFLNCLSKAGFILCLSSGRHSMEKAELVKKITGINHFKHVLGPEVIGCDKIATEYYEKVLQILKIEPGETLSIGDRLILDIEPAKAVRIKTMWINRWGAKKPVNPQSTPDYEVKNLIEALDVINRTVSD